MAFKHVLFMAATSLALLAVVCARTLPDQVKKPVGKCPAVDGPNPSYLADDSDCHLFYECSGGVPNLKECLPELCFDATLNVCAFPNRTLETSEQEDFTFEPLTAVGKCPPRDTNETIFLPDSANCSLYYQCSNGQAIPKECPPDMSWHNEAKICDWAIDSNCTSSNATFYSHTPREPVGTCPIRDTNVTVFLPDAKNCSVYYICSNGRPIPASCTPGMVWSTKFNGCDWDFDNNCVGDSEQGLRVAAPRSAVGTCPPLNGANPTYLPDSEDCQLYYECDEGIAIQNNCPGELEFNPVLHVCDDPLDAGCKASGGGGGNSTTPQPTDPPASTQQPNSTLESDPPALLF